ncbi:MAG: hypothetical protein JXR60_01155 [Bacteroidales bacterium]|nr:hypothetical protein [Bacteroidales bacterium]
MKRLFLMIAMGAVLSSSVLTSCKKDKEDETPTDTTSTLYTEANGEVTVKDRGKGTGTKTWTADKVWVLDGLVFINEGQTLTIEAGTVIKGMPGEGVDASALIVARGGKIMAEGTATNPIVFTGQGTLTNQKGTWGGLIVLGKARLNTTPDVQQVEGIDTSEPRAEFGGNDDHDDSGVIKYVSIRHSGSNIGADNEINGLTLGAVGDGTTIDYVEITYNKDDGIEFFGGTVNVKHALVAYCGDDSYDYDMGYRGKGQFWVSLQDGDSDRNGEHDGGTSPETAEPYATPTIYNATYIGHGTNRIATFRDNAGGYYYNSIFAEMGKGIDIERLNNDDGTLKESSYSRFNSGNGVLRIAGNIFSNVAGQTDASNPTKLINFATYQGKDQDGENINIGMSASDSTLIANYFSQAYNEVMNLNITVTNPTTTDQVTTPIVVPNDDFFDQAAYNGAFGATNWASGWTLTYQN